MFWLDILRGWMLDTPRNVCGIARCAELYGIFAVLLHAWYAMGCLQRFWTLGMQQNLCGVARCAAPN